MTFRLSSLFSVPLALALLVPLSMSTLACGGEDDDGNVDECETSTLTYANFGETFFEDYCVKCHAPGAAGRQAPDLDTYANVVANSATANARAGLGITMPPLDPKPSAENRDLLNEWISCGAKE